MLIAPGCPFKFGTSGSSFYSSLYLYAYTCQPYTIKVGTWRTVEIIPKPQFFRKSHLPIRDRRAAALAKVDMRHAFKVHDRAAHGTRDRADNFEAGARTCGITKGGETLKSENLTTCRSTPTTYETAPRYVAPRLHSSINLISGTNNRRHTFVVLHASSRDASSCRAVHQQPWPGRRQASSAFTRLRKCYWRQQR